MIIASFREFSPSISPKCYVAGREARDIQYANEMYHVLAKSEQNGIMLTLTKASNPVHKNFQAVQNSMSLGNPHDKYLHILFSFFKKRITHIWAGSSCLLFMQIRCVLWANILKRCIIQWVW